MRRAWLAAGLTASTAAGHVVYPILLGLVARRRPLRSAAEPTAWPAVTVLVPAYLEAGVIEQKIVSVYDSGYPGELQVLVVADGDPETAAIAERAGADVLLLPERHGKAQALNKGVAEARYEYVVLTDANNTLQRRAIERLVTRLLDPAVGAVAGEKIEGTGGELAYWRFESWLKSQEDRMGTTLGLDGGLCALRRSTWRPIPPDISNDDFWVALDLMERGLQVAYAPDAAVEEESIGDLSLSWERRTRVLGGGLWVMWCKRRLLDPRRGFVSAQLWGHKLWRSTVGPLSHLALVGVAATGARRSWLARLFLLGNLGAVASIRLQEADVRLPWPARVAAQVMYLQLVALGGMLRFLRGDRVLKWKKPAR